MVILHIFQKIMTTKHKSNANYWNCADCRYLDKTVLRSVFLIILGAMLGGSQLLANDRNATDGCLAQNQSNKDAEFVMQKLHDNLKSMTNYCIDICIESEYGSSSSNLPYIAELCGELTISNQKFRLINEDLEIYCDSKSIYTYDKNRKEVNIEKFNAKDINNIFMNPSALLNFNAELFDIKSYSKNGASRFIELSAKPSARLPISQLTLEFKGTNWWPSSISSSDSKINNQIQNICIEITEPKAISVIEDQAFVFDTKKNPKVNVIDFR